MCNSDSIASNKIGYMLDFKGICTKKWQLTKTTTNQFCQHWILADSIRPSDYWNSFLIMCHLCVSEKLKIPLTLSKLESRKPLPHSHSILSFIYVDQFTFCLFFLQTYLKQNIDFSSWFSVCQSWFFESNKIIVFYSTDQLLADM